MDSQRSPSLWWPFSASELQAGLGVFGFAATALAFAGMEPQVLAAASLGYAVLFYLAGLLVHSRRAARTLTFFENGGVAGAGYLESFRRVKRCLFLMHVDDDPPSEELQALYRRLLEHGIQIRRTVFLRSDATAMAYDWIIRFGDHPNLRQRFVPPEQASVMRFSFVVVDESVVLLSVPGREPIDGSPYTSQLVLRHLLRIEDRDVAGVFLKVHEDIWQHAQPLGSAAELPARAALVRLRSA